VKAENKVLGLACLLTLIRYTEAYMRVPVLPLYALEPALLTQPTVAEAAGVGAPHGELGEEVAAYVTLRPRATAFRATADPRAYGQGPQRGPARACVQAALRAALLCLVFNDRATS